MLELTATASLAGIVQGVVVHIATNSLFKLETLPIYDLVGKTDLAEIFLIMKESKLFIGNDSGLMHLSALADIPTIGLPLEISKRYLDQ